MKKGKIIYLDCDEVLLRTAETHAVFLQQVYNLRVNTLDYPSKWDFNGFHNLNFNDSTRLFIESDYFANISPIDQAQEAVEILKNSGFKLSVITSISDKKYAKNIRIKNLKNIFGSNTFDNINFMPLGWNNKYKFFKKSDQGIAIDDSIFNIQDAIMCNHDGIFITIKQNSNWHGYAKDNGIITANSLYEAVKSNLIR